MYMRQSFYVQRESLCTFTSIEVEFYNMSAFSFFFHRLEEDAIAETASPESESRTRAGADEYLNLWANNMQRVELR